MSCPIITWRTSQMERHRTKQRTITEIILRLQNPLSQTPLPPPPPPRCHRVTSVVPTATVEQPDTYCNSASSRARRDTGKPPNLEDKLLRPNISYARSPPQPPTPLTAPRERCTAFQAAFRGYRLRYRLRRLPAREAERAIRALHVNAHGFRRIAVFLVFFGLFFSLVFSSADVDFQRTVHQGLESHLGTVREPCALTTTQGRSCVGGRWFWIPHDR